MTYGKNKWTRLFLDASLDNEAATTPTFAVTAPILGGYVLGMAKHHGQAF